MKYFYVGYSGFKDGALIYGSTLSSVDGDIFSVFLFDEWAGKTLGYAPTIMTIIEISKLDHDALVDKRNTAHRADSTPIRY